MRRVFDCWQQIAARLHAAGTVALFLDFDGTLARLRQRPEEVRLNHSTRQAIARLARNPRVRVWLISGRRLADVRIDRKSTRLNSSHRSLSRMPSSA